MLQVSVEQAKRSWCLVFKEVATELALCRRGARGVGGLS